jgi:hypothetical protein
VPVTAETFLRPGVDGTFPPERVRTEFPSLFPVEIRVELDR